MLTKITLENFKGYRTPTTIPLAPITLLYGPNSAGKSSIFHALLYLYEILQNDWCDVDTCSLAPVNLGGFFNVLSRDATEQAIRFSAEFTPSAATYTDSHRALNFDPDEFHYRCETLGLGIVQPTGELGAALTEVKLEVRWSVAAQKPYVSYLAFYYDREQDKPPFFVIETDDTLEHTAITNIDFHGRFTITDSPQTATSFHQRLLAVPQEANNATKDSRLRIPIDTSPSGAKPVLGKVLKTHFTDYAKRSLFEQLFSIQHSEGESSLLLEEKRNSLRALDELEEILTSFFTQAAIEYLEDLTSILESMAAIGPMRTVPPRNFMPNRRLHPQLWYDGIAGWDATYLASDKQFSQMSQWMFRLQTGYTLHRNRSDPATRVNPTPLPSGAIDTVALRDLEGHLFSPCDLGIGISQVLPVIAATCLTEVGIVYVEQPELHLHPALQVRLGDLFCAHVEPLMGYRGHVDSDVLTPVRGGDRLFLLETHSEHLMLRILRRIRETDDGEIAQPELQLFPQDIAVIYVDNQRGGSTATRLRVDAQGEFLDRWPRGFFTERSEELF
jgi:hypothetical protein